MISRRALLQGSLAAALAAPMRRVRAATPLRLGVLLPFSGGLEVVGHQARLGVELAVARLNAAGGVLGAPIEITWQDDKTDPKTAVERATSLIQRQKVAAIIGPILSPSRDAILAVHQRHQVPLLYAASFEGTTCSPQLFNVGTVPNQELDALLAELGGGADKPFYLFGADIAWGQKLFPRARALLSAQGSPVAGQELLALGTTDFSATLRRIADSGARVLVQAFPGAGGLNFLKQASQFGLLRQLDYAYVGFSESGLRALQPGEGEGIWTQTPFVASLRTEAAASFVAAARQHAPAILPTRFATAHYNAVLALAGAAERSKDTSREALLQGLPGVALDGPSGPVTLDPASRAANQTLYLGRVQAGELVATRTLGRIQADTLCG